MLRNVVFLLVFTSLPALPADEALKAPEVEVGDCWSYRARNIENRGPIDEYDECVTFIDRAKNVILAVVTVKADGREIDTSYTTTWSPRTGITGLVVTPVGQSQPVQYPLRVGDTYHEERDIRRVELGPVTGRSSMKFKVTGWEEVSVPAGKFRALKIEGDGTTTRSDNWRTAKVSIEFWHVPEVNRFVKFRFRSPALDYGAELTGYRPKK
jgi:hypothetical protein